MSILEMKTVKITERGQIAIPKNIRKIEGFKIGSKIAIVTFDDHLEIRPMNQISEKMFTALASEKILAKDWLSKEDEKAWKNL